MTVLKAGMYLLNSSVTTCGVGTCKLRGSNFSARYPVWLNAGDTFTIDFYNASYQPLKFNNNGVDHSSKFIPETPYGTTWLWSEARSGAVCNIGTTSYGGNDYYEALGITLHRFTD